MLLLGVGAVADAHRLGVLVAVEVQQHLLGQRLLAADAVHDLQLVVGLRGDVADEIEEVVGLLVEAQRVEAPEHEGRVADPGVAVVPVSLAAGRLGQRRGRRRDHRAGRRVGQPLEGQRAALQVGAPRVVGELAVAEPLVPVVGGEDEAVVGVVVGLGPAVIAPRQRDERGVAVAQGRARAGAAALEADAQVGGERQRERLALGRADRLAVAGAAVLPGDALAPVVHARLALHVHLDAPVHAAHRAQQDVVGVVVGRRAPVRVRALVVVVPGPDRAARRGR